MKAILIYRDGPKLPRKYWTHNSEDLARFTDDPEIVKVIGRLQSKLPEKIKLDEKLLEKTRYPNALMEGYPKVVSEFFAKVLSLGNAEEIFFECCLLYGLVERKLLEKMFPEEGRFEELKEEAAPTTTAAAATTTVTTTTTTTESAQSPTSNTGAIPKKKKQVHCIGYTGWPRISSGINIKYGRENPPKCSLATFILDLNYYRVAQN